MLCKKNIFVKDAKYVCDPLTVSQHFHDGNYILFHLTLGISNIPSIKLEFLPLYTYSCMYTEGSKYMLSHKY